MLLVAAAVTAACDAVYFARIDVGSFEGQADTADALSSEERDRCVAVFAATAKEFGLDCHESKYPIITGSYDSELYHLTECQEPEGLTQVQLAVGPHHMSVELQDIAGLREPESFRRYRIGFSERLQKECGEDKVTVRYPYQW